MNAAAGLVLVLSSPSGAGKSTLVRRWLALEPALTFSVSHTTRTPRPGELDGRDYRFVTRDEFTAIKDRGGFLEWAEYNGEWYGTSQAEVERARAERKDLLLEIEVQGAAQVVRALPESVTIFLLPPSYQELERRLRGRPRGAETETVLASRLRRACEEVRHWEKFRYLVVNEELEQATADLRAILAAERLSPRSASPRSEQVPAARPDAAGAERLLSSRRSALAARILATFPAPRSTSASTGNVVA